MNENVSERGPKADGVASKQHVAPATSGWQQIDTSVELMQSNRRIRGTGRWHAGLCSCTLVMFQTKIYMTSLVGRTVS